MKPLDIAQYRAKWLPGTKVNVDDGLRNKAEKWCKENLDPWQWKLSKQTDWDINSYSFENSDDAYKFREDVCGVREGYYDYMLRKMREEE